MKVAALDLGSNTFLCLIAEIENHQVIHTYYDQVEYVRLGQELEKNKAFHPEALARAEKAFIEFSNAIKEHKPERILAMATAAARAAENRSLLTKMAEQHNIPLEIISGEKEADLTYRGAISGLLNKNQSLMVIDIGGRSTEFIFGQGEQRRAAHSFEMGCVRLTEKFISTQPTSDHDLKLLSAELDLNFKKALELKPTDFKIDELIAVAGTPTTLVQTELGAYDPEKIDGFVLTPKKLDEWRVRLQKASVSEKIQMGIPAGRADVLLVGVLILIKTLEHFKLSSLKVSTRGLRYGVALEIFQR